METKDLKTRTDKLKSDINALLTDYCNETDLKPQALQAIRNTSPDDRYTIELGLAL